MALSSSNEHRVWLEGQEVLDRETCLRFLRGTALGRLGFLVDGAPRVLPINFTMDGERVAFRTDPGAKLWAALAHPIAFEADGPDDDGRSWWSVLVLGSGEQVDDAAAVAHLETLPLRPWSPGAKAYWVLITPDQITGRRVVSQGSEAPSDS